MYQMPKTDRGGRGEICTFSDILNLNSATSGDHRSNVNIFLISLDTQSKIVHLTFERQSINTVIECNMH